MKTNSISPQLLPKVSARVRANAGFTLIELMVVIAIVAILMVTAVPSFSRLIATTAVSGHVNTFIADARYARTEAIKRGRTVSMCRSDNPEAAAPACSAVTSTNWSNGWLIFIDTNTVGTIDAGDTLLRLQPTLDRSGGITTTGGTAYDFFTFDSLGRVNQNGTLLVQPQGTYTGVVNRELVIDTVGRVRWRVPGTP